jgi:uncharacterized protein (DUF433 family)
MSALPTTAVVPLFTDPHGTIRVRGTRVTLDIIITAFGAGATAEEIVQRFPSVASADVYQIIAHYLNHTAQIDTYLSDRKAEAERLEREAETRSDPIGVRSRLMARRRASNAT